MVLNEEEVRELAEYLIRCNLRDPDYITSIEMCEEYFDGRLDGEDMDRVLFAYQTATVIVKWEDRYDD